MDYCGLSCATFLGWKGGGSSREAYPEGEENSFIITYIYDSNLRQKRLLWL